MSAAMTATFDPPRKPGTGWERGAPAMSRGPRPAKPKPLQKPPTQPGPSPDSAAPMVCPECNAPILGPSHVCKRRLDPVTTAWLARYRRTARRLPHLDAEQLGARVEQHLTGVAA